MIKIRLPKNKSDNQKTIFCLGFANLAILETNSDKNETKVTHEVKNKTKSISSADNLKQNLSLLSVVIQSTHITWNKIL